MTEEYISFFKRTIKKEQSCNCDNVGITIQTVLTDVPKFLIVYINRCLYDRQHKLNGKIQIANKFEITKFYMDLWSQSTP